MYLTALGTGRAEVRARLQHAEDLVDGCLALLDLLDARTHQRNHPVGHRELSDRGLRTVIGDAFPQPLVQGEQLAYLDSEVSEQIGWGR